MRTQEFFMIFLVATCISIAKHSLLLVFLELNPLLEPKINLISEKL